mgnify:CR=1 FL=1
MQLGNVFPYNDTIEKQIKSKKKSNTSDKSVRNK